MLEVFLLVTRVYADEKMVVGDFVDQDVIHKTAMFVEQPRILDLAYLKARGGVRRRPIGQFGGLGPTNVDLAHVAYVEQARPLPYRLMLIQNSRILDRHIPAAEIDHSGAGRPVKPV